MRISGNWALIPVKSAVEAKTRLAGKLCLQQRIRLQRAMLADLLEGLAACRLLSGIALYGPETRTAEEGTYLRVIHLRQPADVQGLNGAVSDGTQCLVEAGADVVAVLPGDLPLAEGEELDRVLSNVAQQRCCAVIPDRWRNGTNGLVFPAEAHLRFSFGPESFERHLSERQACSSEALELTSFALDIDTTEDLIAFRQAQQWPRGRFTRAVIDGIAREIGDAAEVSAKEIYQ